MAITNTWTVTQMDCYPQAEGQTDVVFTCHWTLTATDGTYTGSAYGTVGVTYAAGAPFTPYTQLTEAMVVGWVQATLGAAQVTAFEENVAQQIADQIAPPTVTPPLPWASTPAASPATPAPAATPAAATAAPATPAA